MKLITSKDNPQLKEVRALLKDARYRQTLGVVVIEGEHLVQVAAQSHAVVQLTVVAKGYWEQWLSLGIPEQALVVPDELFRGLSHLTQGSTVLQVVKPIQSPTVRNIESDAVLLEGLQDPGNLGTLIRSAVAAGLNQFLLSAHCADPWSPKALRAGMGAQFHAQISQNIDPLAAIGQFKGRVLATALRARSMSSLYELDLSVKAGFNLWCFGSEGSGLSKESLDVIETHSNAQFVRIEHSQLVESLNVANAATLCLFEQRRQRQL
jgi:RNA methyltransferase, TrmH family